MTLKPENPVPPSTQEHLERSRKELLDLSTRNRLLSIPVGSKSARIIQVHDELSEQVYRLLVTEAKSLAFLPGRDAKPSSATHHANILGEEPDEDDPGLPQPEDEEEKAGSIAKRHIDARLQTALTAQHLQTRLLDLYRDARTMIEEQGVNILYLALGQLKWFEAAQADIPRYAPLILVPVELKRNSAAERFTLRWISEDIQENLSLRAKLKSDFDIELPPFPDDEELSPTAYFNAVAQTVSAAKGWEVLPNAITLGFFSFAKFLMYRDLDPKNWPNADLLLKHPFITGLLHEGFSDQAPLFSEETHLDTLIPAARLDHVVDADSSQSLAIEAVRQGRSVVIQGPPGTGKSQSITNIIATAVLDGKRVLFVAEKLAALEVVKRRLEKEQLGDICLELHSNKSNKRAVIEEIGRTWKLGRPKHADLESLVPKLESHRAILNGHVAALHERHEPSRLSPFAILGQLAMLGDKGEAAADLTFTDAEQWTPDDRAERRKLIEELIARIEEIGLPIKHPWRGADCETVLQIDLSPLATRIRTVLARIAEMRETSAQLSTALPQPATTTFGEIEHQCLIANYVAVAPPLDKQALCNGVWNAGLDGLNDLLAQGKKLAQAVEQVGRQVTESVWEQDFAAARTAIAALGRSWLRFFNGDYRRAIAQLRGSLTGELPKTCDERVTLADQIIAGQRALRALRESEALGQSAFGQIWRREKTNWSQLEAILDWVTKQRAAGLDATFSQVFSVVKDQQSVSQLHVQLSTHLATASEETRLLFQTLQLDCPVAFGAPDLARVPLAELTARCPVWLAHLEDLSRWSNYFVRARRARLSGLGSLVARLESGAVPTTVALHGFDLVYYGQLLRHFARLKPELAQFDGTLHEKHIREFRQLDKGRLGLAKYQTLMAHFDRLPPINSGVGPAGIVKGELERKRGHRTVRRLLKDAGSVVQAIKPVFMMSPLSVAQFLEPGAVEFDLLVIDEASQVQPVDALGALARCKQIVVVGDSKQLPPTRFFTRLTTDSGEPDDDFAAAQAKDIESILGLCCARGLPQTMLRWHYRSRHHSLIAVSNHEFYENGLFIVPSPHSTAAGLGLRFNYLPEGVFDSGATGTNRVEAKAICHAVIKHARHSPHLSLGVAAFSVRQQQAILDELELLRREHPETEEFFAAHPTEPFFVKNLENVQGDERDVIFISVGYGRDTHGNLAMRFGPLSMEGGERRLNVLISRAKQRCEVFTSITADDIDLERASGRGVAAFKTFLSFAQTGRLATAARSGQEEQSAFEEAVCQALTSLGHEVHPQVGIAGFYIDLAIVNSEQPGAYLIGIECDGAPYHSSRSARDRDRLRQAVLEDHGWIIHRIWSTDWFQRPAEQLRKVAQAIADAKVAAATNVQVLTTPVKAPAVTTEESIEREELVVTSDSSLAGISVPYRESNFAVPANLEPHELSAKAMAELLERIVQDEGPIHEDEVTNRLRTLWNLGRAGSRVQDAVAKGVRSLLVGGRCTREEGFLSITDAPVPIRNREAVSSVNLRKADLLPPAEIRAAILAVIDVHHGASPREIPPAVARLFGFKTTSIPLRTLIETQTAKLINQGQLEENSGMLKRSLKTV